MLAIVRIHVDHHIARPRRPQIARHLASHAAVTADQIVVSRGVDHLLHPALVDQPGQPTRHEELGDRRQGIEERTYAEHLEDDLEGAAGAVARFGDGAEGGHRVQRPHEPVSDRYVTDDREADGSHHDHHRERGEEDPEPARELHQLPAGAPTLNTDLMVSR